MSSSAAAAEATLATSTAVAAQVPPNMVAVVVCSTFTAQTGGRATPATNRQAIIEVLASGHDLPVLDNPRLASAQAGMASVRYHIELFGLGDSTLRLRGGRTYRIHNCNGKPRVWQVLNGPGGWWRRKRGRPTQVPFRLQGGMR